MATYSLFSDQILATRDKGQLALIEKNLQANLREIATRFKKFPVGQYPDIRLEAVDGRYLTACLEAVALRRSTTDPDLHQYLDDFVMLELPNLWPALRDPQFEKLVQEDWRKARP